MFFKNLNGLQMDAPYTMEQVAYDYAMEVYSISDNLMNLEGYNVYELPIAQKLRDRILRRFPDAITDSEYLAKRNAVVEDTEGLVFEKVKIEEVVKKAPVRAKAKKK